MTQHQIVSPDAWLAARKTLLAKEKEFNRLRDRLAAERQALPWVKVEKRYVFDGPAGKETLADLFGNRGQLIVYHFMLGPDWEEGCKSCSYLADHFDGANLHLPHRDVTLVAVSRAPFPHIEAFRRRMGWRFPWVSSYGTDFNADFHVSFTQEEMASGQVYYNYGLRKFGVEEGPGLSVFHKDTNGEVFHTYSCYARGIDTLNAAYQYLDLVPKGRDEGGLSYSMAWLKHRDMYGR